MLWHCFCLEPYPPRKEYPLSLVLELPPRRANHSFPQLESEHPRLVSACRTFFAAKPAQMQANPCFLPVLVPQMPPQQPKEQHNNKSVVVFVQPMQMKSCQFSLPVISLPSPPAAASAATAART